MSLFHPVVSYNGLQVSSFKKGEFISFVEVDAFEASHRGRNSAVCSNKQLGQGITVPIPTLLSETYKQITNGEACAN